MSDPPAPRTLRAVLLCALPGDWRADIVRDLDELYARRRARGRVLADLWYLRQVAGFSLRFVRERLRDHFREGGGMMNSRTVGQAVRRLVRAPGFSVPILLLLALGLGASATMFAVVDGVLLEPLPFPDSKDLVVLCERHPSVEGYCIGSVPTTRDLGRAAASLETAGAARGWSYSYEDGGEIEGVSGGIAAPEFFDALEVQPALGRLFTPDEIGPDHDDVLVLSHAFWTRRYGADPAVIGRTVHLDGEPVEIVGVLPAGLEVPTLEWVEVWRPLHVDIAEELNRGWRGFTALGRLAPGATLGSARAELSSLYRGLGAQHEAIGDDWRLEVHTLKDEIVGNARGPLWAFLAGVLLLLLIAAANVASLVVARSVARRRDAAIRVALGARVRTLVGDVMVEGGLLALVATALGLGLAVLGLHVLLAFAPPGVPRLDNVGLDGSVMLFAVGLGGFTVLVFALAAAFRARGPVGASLGSARPAGLDVRGMGPHRWLVTGEVALSVVLVFTSLLLARSFMGFLGWNPGIDLDRVVVVPAIASSGTHESGADVMRFWRRAEEELAGLPGVDVVGTGSAVPLRGGIERAQIRISGLEDVPREDLPSARWYDVGPSYFDALGVPVVRGRALTEADGPDAPPVALVNEAFARTFWPGEDPVGKWIEDAEGLTQAAGRRLAVVGVVRDIPPLTPGEPVHPEFYYSNRQFGRWGAMFVVRAEAGSAAGLGARVVERLQAVDATLTLSSPRTMAELFAPSLARPRFNLLLGGVFAVTAVVLAGLGLYGVLSHAVARQRRAIGLRMAVGCTSGGIVRRVLRDGVALVVLGSLVGLVLALVAGRALSGLIFGVPPDDPASLGGTVGVLVGLALLASAVPAVRAGRLDPARLLRED